MATELVQAHWNQGSGSLSMQVLQEFYVTVTNKIRKPIRPQLARQLVTDLSKWKRHVPEIEDILSAVDLHTELKISFWDAMILQSAFALGCDTIYSEDFDMNRNYRGLKVVNPFK
ncbi:MAG: PIN domain-containing protein [Chloroflexi bacterium]|nr:PIN domain-containing protein [Chloroflexota bacterium]